MDNLELNIALRCQDQGYTLFLRLTLPNPYIAYM
jgi:hypothetical protein